MFMQKKKRIQRWIAGVLFWGIFAGLLISAGFCTRTAKKTGTSENKAGVYQTDNETEQTPEKYQTEADPEEDWALILVNREHTIPENYEVSLVELSNGQCVDERIYPYLQQMFDDARAEGLGLFVREGYRTEEEQEQIMEERIEKYEAAGYSKKEAKQLAESYVALPGTSEHQLGLSVDINADNDVSTDDAVYTWLEEHAYEYGFIKRYPSDKTEITGISNEPWHYRYVGKEAALAMKEQNLCLEEYLEKR